MTDSLVALIEAARFRTPVVGVSVLVARGDDILLSQGFGLANAEYEIPMTARTLSRAASITKIITALLVAKYVDRGDIYFDQPLREVVPGIREDLGGATVRDLLTHRSGLPTGPDETQGIPPRNEDIAAFVRDNLPLIPLTKPGEYAYSNAGFAILGRIAEVAGGDAYLNLVQREILDPLGMTSTTFEPSVALTYSCAASHTDEGAVSHRFFDYPGRHPAGFAFSHVEDLRLLANVLHGRTDLVRPETLATMRQPHADCRDGRFYGLGLLVEERAGRNRVGHTGHILGYASRLDTAPDEGVTVAMLFNQSTFRDEARRLSDRLIDKALQ